MFEPFLKNYFSIYIVLLNIEEGPAEKTEEG